MALDFLGSWAVKARNVRLSRCVMVLFALALVLPWFALGWLVSFERAEQLGKTDRNLASLAAAYAEHAAALMRLGIAIPVDGDAPAAAVAAPDSRGLGEMAAFRATLDVPDMRLSLRRLGTDAGASRPGMRTARAVRQDVGIVATASLSEGIALKEWRDLAYAQILALLLRTLLVAAIGAVLVHQLRWREKAQAELAVARAAAESASRTKSDFLANMSHELRTPLNAIIGFSELIKTGMLGPLNARYREYGADIFDSGKHLLHLINEILDLSKLEAGQFELHDEDVDLSDVIAASLRLVQAQAERSKVLLSKDVPDGLPMIRADDRRMRQVLINLLSNAVKFTPEGGRVHVSALRDHRGVVIAVRDTGIGMTPEQVAKALEPFGQIENAFSRKHDGTGLGLPLAKRLVELHGGTLTIASEIDVGTTATIGLPPQRISAGPVHLAAAKARA